MVISFAYQIDNGYPILPFREDKDDTEFVDLIKILKDIASEDDCRNFIRSAFKISEIMSTDTDSYAHIYDEVSDSDEESLEDDPLDVFLECHRTLSKSTKKSSTCSKKKVKKGKKRMSIKNMKKVNSVCIKAPGGIAHHFNDPGLETPMKAEHTVSNKCVSPTTPLSRFEENPNFGETCSESVPLEEI